MTDEDDYDIDYEKICLEQTVLIDRPNDAALERYERVARLAEQNFETFVKKNSDYGASYIEGAKAEMSAATPHDEWWQAAAYRLLVRADDKHRRLHQLLYGDGEPEVDESAVDAALDAANYYLLMAEVLESEQEVEVNVDGL